MMRSSNICIHRILFGDQIEKNEMGETCSTLGRGQGNKGFGCGDLRERDHLEDTYVDGMIIK